MIPVYGAVVILLAAGGLGAYEWYALRNGKPNDTISAIIWAWTQKTMLLPIAWGFLTAHFFLNGNNWIGLAIGLLLGAIWFHKGGGLLHL